MDDDAALTDSVLDRVRGLVNHETPSGHEAGVLALAEELAAAFSDTGAAVEVIDSPGYGRHLRVTLAGADRSQPPLLLLGHLDTVHPLGTLAERPFRVVDDRAEGPGVFDMKAGIAVLLEALALMRAEESLPRRDVVALFTCDEEIGSPTSRALIERHARAAHATLVLEPSLPGGAAKTARKGLASYRLRVRGRAAHAGVDPERGISAIAEAAHQTLRILALADARRGTTLNIGVIRGGTAENVVPAEAVVEFESRFTERAEFDRVDAALRALEPVLTGAVLELEGGENRPALERTAGVAALYEHARGLARELGFDLAEGATGGGSDGNFAAATGTPTLDGLGPDGGGAHAVDEHILVAGLPQRVRLVRRLLETV